MCMFLRHLPLSVSIFFIPDIDENEIIQETNIFGPAVGSRDSDDLRQNSSSPTPFPPEYYLSFLQNATIMQKIGAESPYEECGDAPDRLFGQTGDVRALLSFTLFVLVSVESLRSV